jgi:hypothetical protein
MNSARAGVAVISCSFYHNDGRTWRHVLNLLEMGYEVDACLHPAARLSQRLCRWEQRL